MRCCCFCLDDMKNTMMWSWGYWFSALSLGLLLHPYATLRKMVRDKLLRPLIFLPLVATVMVWGVAVVVVHVGAVVALGLGVDMPEVSKWLLAFLFWWMWWFLGLWQVVLLYL